MWGKGRSDGEPGRRLVSFPACFAPCGNLCQVRISRQQMFMSALFVVAVGISHERQPDLVRDLSSNRMRAASSGPQKARISFARGTHSSKKHNLGTRSPSMFREASFASRFPSFACSVGGCPWLNLARLGL